MRKTFKRKIFYTQMILLKLLRESLIFAFSSVMVNKLRTLLSLLGITIGIFAIISVFTIVIRWKEISGRTLLSLAIMSFMSRNGHGPLIRIMPGGFICAGLYPTFAIMMKYAADHNFPKVLFFLHQRADW
jgi:hypothetical protein